MNDLGTKRLNTDRLCLRKINLNDYKKAYLNWCSRDNVLKYVLWNKHESEEITRLQYEKWITVYKNKNVYRWIVEIADSGEVIGLIDGTSSYQKFGSIEIGYIYGDKYWGNGYATEALKRVIKYLFEECNYDTIFAECMEDNCVSIKVLEKCGMIYEGILKSRVIDKQGKRVNLLSYSITKDLFFNKNKDNF